MSVASGAARLHPVLSHPWAFDLPYITRSCFVEPGTTVQCSMIVENPTRALFPFILLILFSLGCNRQVHTYTPEPGAFKPHRCAIRHHRRFYAVNLDKLANEKERY